MRYLVTKQEIWTQRVSVEADTPEEARIKAEEGKYEINEDPQYLKDNLESLWDVKEE